MTTAGNEQLITKTLKGRESNTLLGVLRKHPNTNQAQCFMCLSIYFVQIGGVEPTEQPSVTRASLNQLSYICAPDFIKAVK